MNLDWVLWGKLLATWVLMADQLGWGLTRSFASSRRRPRRSRSLSSTGLQRRAAGVWKGTARDEEGRGSGKATSRHY